MFDESTKRERETGKEGSNNCVMNYKEHMMKVRLVLYRRPSSPFTVFNYKIYLFEFCMQKCTL